MPQGPIIAPPQWEEKKEFELKKVVFNLALNIFKENFELDPEHVFERATAFVDVARKWDEDTVLRKTGFVPDPNEPN